MDLLELSLKSHLPFVHVKTDDLVHVQEVLEYISGERVRPLTADTPLDQCPSDILYTSSADLAVAQVYTKIRAAKKTLVFVNQKPSVMFHDGGQLMPPKSMMLDYLREQMEDPENAEEALPAFGGMTLKEMFEACKLTIKAAGKVTAKGINDTRRSYISKLKGISQVETDCTFYQCPSYLDDWLGLNAKFFLNPTIPEMTPRGLLFEGPPGTGKTLASKYIAKTLNVPLYHLDIAGAKGKYVGDSEGAIAAALAQVDKVEPCVVLIDEVEKIFSAQSDQGVTTSMLGSLLWWLQEHKSRVLTIMTTNNKAALPKELYRPGRIDKAMMFSGLTSSSAIENFAMETYSSFASRLWPEGGYATAEEFLPLVKQKLKALVGPSGAVPQVTVWQFVLEFMKGMV